MAALLVIFLIPPVYRTQASAILVTSDIQGPPPAVFGLRAPTPLDILEGILRSEPLRQRIALVGDMPPDTVDDYLRLEKLHEQNKFVLYTEDADTTRAKRCLAETLTALADLNESLAIGAAAQQARYLSQAVPVWEEKLKTQQNQLTAFQQKMKAPTDPRNNSGVADILKRAKDIQFELAKTSREIDTIKAGLESRVAQSLDLPTDLTALESIRSNIRSLERKLASLEEIYGPSHPEYLAALRELRIAKEAGEVEVATALAALNANLNTELSNMVAKKVMLEWQLEEATAVANVAPSEASTLYRLSLEVETTAAVLQQLKKQLEQANVDAQVDKVRWSVLESPTTIHPPVNKRYVRTPLIVFLLTTFLVIGLHRYSRSAAMAAQPIVSAILNRKPPTP